MISGGLRQRVLAYASPVDMRKGFDGLYALVREGLGHDPLSGDLYLFLSRDRVRAKVLVWDGTGLCVYAKRLEQGRFACLWETGKGGVSRPLRSRQEAGSTEETGAQRRASRGPSRVPRACRANRRASIVAEILGEEFSGLLMRDGWRSYDARLGYAMLRCLVHLKRNAEDLEDAQEGAAAAAMRLFVVWLDGIFALRQSSAELDASRYECEAWELIEWFEEFVEQPQSSPSNQRFVARPAEIRDQVLPLVEDPTLPATNNLAERQIRPAVIHRKISAGNKTEHGARALAILASLTTSCRQQGQSFLNGVPRLLSAPVGQSVPFWLPDPAPS